MRIKSQGHVNKKVENQRRQFVTEIKCKVRFKKPEKSLGREKKLQKIRAQ